MKTLLIFVALSLTSCSHVLIKDSEWCGDKGQIGATCFNALTPGEVKLDKSSWDKKRLGMVCTSGDTFADWKSDIEKLCSFSKDCIYEVQHAMGDLMTKIAGFHSNAVLSEP